MSIDAQRHEELAVYRELFGSIEKLEWSGTQRGPGSGPMFSGNDGERYAACPICGGLEKHNNSFIASAVGHQPGCRLAALLDKPTRALELGEQGEIAL